MNLPHYFTIVKQHYDPNVSIQSIELLLQDASNDHRAQSSSDPLEDFCATYVAKRITDKPMNEGMPYSEEGMIVWYDTFNELRKQDPGKLVEDLREKTHHLTAEKLLRGPEQQPYNPWT